MLLHNRTRSLAEDVRYAVRNFRRRPAFTAVAIASLALGIAVNATVFSWVQRILLRPLPGVRDSSAIVVIKTKAPDGDLLDSSYLDFRDFRSQSKALEDVIAFKQRPLYMGNPSETERVWSEMVSGNFFDVLGAKPILGRTFTTEEQLDRPGGAPVAVISETLCRRFQTDPAIIGRRFARWRSTSIRGAPQGAWSSLARLCSSSSAPTSAISYSHAR